MKGASAPFSLALNTPRLRDNFLLARGFDALQNGEVADALIDSESVCRRLGRTSLPAVLRAKVLQQAQPTMAAKAWYAAWCRDPQDVNIQDAMLMSFLDAGALTAVQELGALFLSERCKAGSHSTLVQCLLRAGLSTIGACWKRGEALEGMVLESIREPGVPRMGRLLLCSGDHEHAVDVPFDGSRFVIPRPGFGHVWSLARVSSDASGKCVSLAGSPLVFAEPKVGAANIPTLAKSKASRRPGCVNIIVPVYGNPGLVRACIESVLASQPVNSTPTLLTVIDDASPDVDLIAWLDALAATGRISLLRNRFNLGFIEACNRGLRAEVSSDPLLLNADTLVHGDWVDRMRSALYSADDIASVTPWSNNGEISSFPRIARCAPAPDLAQLARIDNAAAALRRSGQTADMALPTCCGFAMLMRRSVIQRMGVLDGVALVRGYNEEVDWCLRAGALGLRHLLATGVFVAHAGTASFGYEKTLRVAQNRAVVQARFPDFYPQYQAFLQHDGVKLQRQYLKDALQSCCTDWLEAALSATSDGCRLVSLLPSALPSTCARIAVSLQHRDSRAEQQVLALARQIAGLSTAAGKLRLLLLGHATEALWRTGVVDVLPAVSVAESHLLGDSALLGFGGCSVLLSDGSIEGVPPEIKNVRLGPGFDGRAWFSSWLKRGVDGECKV